MSLCFLLGKSKPAPTPPAVVARVVEAEVKPKTGSNMTIKKCKTRKPKANLT